jgi:hypothetical protein
MPRLPDGTEFTTDDRGFINSVNGSPATRIPENRSPTFAGSTVLESPNGNPFVSPSFIDYSGLQPAYVSFQQSLDRAHREGDRNRGIYYGELFGDDSRNAALRLVDTDIAGINRGLNEFIPRIRSEGDIDTTTNISRAGRIDEFNLQRTPTFNASNRDQVRLNNQFNREEFATSVEGTGLDYRDRILGTVGRLEQRARGELPGDLADILNKDHANRGSDLLRGSGISSVSGAGIRANDRLTIQERLNLALDADARLPGVLGQAQQLLQAPFETAPTLLSQPTQVPLNVANVADRLPIMSNISAGAAQQSIAGAATELQTISPSTILGNSLATEQFNESSRYNRDLGVLDREQAQLTAADNAVQGALNADKGDQIRGEAYNAFQQGFGIRQDSAGATALGSVGGFIQAASSLFGLGGQGGPSGTGGGYGGGGIPGSVNGGINPSAGGGRGSSSGGGLLQQGIDFVSGVIDSVFSGGDKGGASSSPPRADGGFDVSLPPVESGGSMNIPGVVSEQPIPSGGSSAKMTPQDSLAKAFQVSSQPYPNIKTDTQKLGRTAADIQNWDRYSPNQRADASASVGTDALERMGVVSGDRANQIRSAQGSLSTLTNTSATDGQRATAVANLASLSISTPFTGSVNNPETINGLRVVGSKEGSFELSDGSVVGKDALLNSSNAASTIQAFSVLTSRADKEQKVAALGAIGIRAGVANELVDQVAAGNTNAALSIFSTATNWENMSPVQQAVGITQTSGAVLNAFAANTANAQAQGSGALAYFSGSQAAGTGAALLQGAGIVAGAYGAYQTVDAINNLPRSKATTVGPVGGAASGASIGGSIGGPIGAGIGAVIGAVTGAVLSHTGGGKGVGQKARDGWRSYMEEAGIASKNSEGSHQVVLADGSAYDIGKDGGYKLQNKDGSERHTFDIDWNNPIANETIPDAHVFAIATGLDPTSNADKNTFDRATAQAWNAASSNTDSVEGFRNNVKSMLKNIDPNIAVSRIETLRLTNKISEQEYGVYLDRTNKIFGTNYAPTDRGKAQNGMVEYLSSAPKNNKGAQQLLAVLTSPEELKKAQQRLEERLAGEK